MSLILSGTDGLSDVDGSAATPAIRGTDANTGMFFPAADTIAFSEGGVESMRIDSAANVGIGTNSPTQKLQVAGNVAIANGGWFGFGDVDERIAGDNSGFMQFFTSGTERMRISNSGGDGLVGIGIATPTLNTSGTVLHINNSTASRAAIIHMTNAETGSAAADGLICGKWSDGTNYFYDYDNNPIIFGTNNSNRVTILANGTVQTTSTISVGNATPSTSGAGITFPATQSASSDVNTLDDYEEGTWTPSLAYETPGTSSITFSNRSGQYVKIGKVVYFASDVRIASFSKGTASGQILMTGLPFTSNPSGGGYESARHTIQLYDWTYSSSPIVCNVLASNTVISISRMVSNSVSVTVDDPRGGSIIWITGFYFV
jgi:hypothetical protein